MDLTAYVDALRNSLRTAAAAGGGQGEENPPPLPDNTEPARLLADTMEPAVRLAVLDALSAMAAEVTAALDGDVVEIRVRGRDPEVVVTRVHATEPAPAAPIEEPGDDGGTARISLRLPEALKSRAEAAASAQGGSLNAWLVPAAPHAAHPPSPPPAPPPRGAPPPPPLPPAPPPARAPRRYTGFARS